MNALKRILWCVFPIGIGLLAATALLFVAGIPVRRAQAAGPAAGAAVLIYPGCSPTIQACLLTATAGSTLVIQPGVYITSFTLSTAVSVTGANRNTTILQALSGQRVITAAGAAVGSSVVISGLTIRGGSGVGATCPSGCGGGIIITGGAEPRLSNLLIVGNSADYVGGGVYADGDLSLNSVVFLSNTTAAAGGGVMVTGTLSVNGGLFQNNRCTQAGCYGGGLMSLGTLAVTGTRFTANRAMLRGGGAMAATAANVTGALFENNRCTEVGCGGGGIFANTSLTLIGTDFDSNSVELAGGGAAALGTGSVSGGRFQNNECVETGCSAGGLLVALTLTVTGTQFIGNESSYHGGGVYAGGATELENVVFQNNECSKADCGGAGLYVQGPVTVKGTQFGNNTAQLAGAGAAALSTTTVIDSVFQNNQCVVTGCAGAALLAGGALTALRSEFLGNTSNSHGAAIYVGGLFVASVTASTFRDNHCAEISCTGGAVTALGTLLLTDTIVVSNSSGVAGGGILAAGTVISGGVFEANHCTTADCLGGALAATNSLVVSGTRFISNSAVGSGGALVHTFGNAYLANALFAGNFAPDDGAALHLMSSGNILILHNTIIGGAAGGTGITLLTGTLGITNSIVASYTIGISVTGGTARESHNLFFGNGSNILGVLAAGGSLTAPPQFIAPELGDFHLRRGSAARNLGLDAGVLIDADGDPRLPAGGTDAGIDEYLEFAPVAVGDSYSLTTGNALTVTSPLGVLANDSDANGDALTAVLVSLPATGTLNLSADGSFVYVRPSGFAGVVTFTYSANDGVATSSPVTVTLTLAEVEHRVYAPLIAR